MSSIKTNRGYSANAKRFVSNQNQIHDLIANGQIIKGQSKINYFPFEKKVIEYQDRQYIQYKPVIKKVIDYQQRKYIQYIPREVSVMDYCAVQTIKQYKKEIIPEKSIQYRPVEKSVKKVQYVPIQKQIVYYPSTCDSESVKKQSRVVFKEKGVNIGQNTQFKPFNPGYIYEMASKQNDKATNIGYYQKNYLRKFSNTQSTERLLPYNCTSRNNVNSKLQK